MLMKSTRNLQMLRRNAGYRCASDFRDASGIEKYVKYEYMKEDMPLSIAWELADRFNVSIDEIVGRVKLRELD